MTMGTFSISYFTFGTAFGDQDGKKSKAFENLKQYRYEIAIRQAEQNPNYNGQIVDSTGFPLGYGPVSQDVLVPAFLAAYSGKGPQKIGLSTLPTIPMPNWRITYNGFQIRITETVSPDSQYLARIQIYLYRRKLCHEYRV